MTCVTAFRNGPGSELARLGLAATLVVAVGGSARSQDAPAYLGPRMPYAEFDALPHMTLSATGATLDLRFAPGLPNRQLPAIRRWVDDSARAIAAYLGKFPVARLRILIVPVPGDAIHGATWGTLGAATRITVSSQASDDDIVHSWMLTHELVHVSFPQLARRYIWLEEGLATCIKPIARAQAELVTPEYVWRHFLWGMAQGLPKSDDQGLDHTHTWGRTYCGDALFCQLVDIDLDGLWKRLGVAVAGGNVEFDDTAPLAAIRRAITRPDAQP